MERRQTMRVNRRECVLLLFTLAVIAALLNSNGRLQKRVAAKAQTVRDLQQALNRLTADMVHKESHARPPAQQ